MRTYKNRGKEELRLRKAFLLNLVFLFLMVCPVRATSEYYIIDIGTLGEDPESKAFGINDRGQVVGYSGMVQGPEEGRRAFIWDSTNGIRSLGTLGGNHSEAYGINNAGQVVGRSTLASGEYDVRGFIWENGSMSDLGTLEGGWTEAHGINNSREVVGYSVLSSSVTAFLWKNGSMSNLESLTGNSRGYAINDTGQIVGYVNPIAFMWENGIITLLGTLGGNRSYAWDINNNRQVIGSSGTGGYPSYSHAFFWENSTMTDLGTLSGNWSEAYSINDTGQIVGQSAGHAFLWENGTMTDLNEFLPIGSEWLLLEATAINNKGQIVGCGYISGKLHAFLMTPLIYADIDIKPNSLNLANKGRWVTCEIFIPEDCNAADVNSSSILLEDQIPADWVWFNEEQNILMAKFNRLALQEILEPGEVELIVRGYFDNGTYFEGIDTIKVIDKKSKE